MKSFCYAFLIIFSILTISQEISDDAQIIKLVSEDKVNYRENRFNEAIAICEKAISLNTQNFDLVFQIGKILIDCKKIDEGLNIIVQNISHKPEYNKHLQLAMLADDYRKYSLALEHYKSCLKIKETSKVHHKIAMILEETGKKELSLFHRSRSVAIMMPEIRGLKFKNLWGRPLQLIDCQNIFCEVDKYSRLAHPEIKGVNRRKKIKQRYTPNLNTIHYWFPPKWGLHCNR